MTFIWLQGMHVRDIPLIAGHPVLDFTNSWENPGLAGEVNYLADYATLIAWAVRAELLSEAEARPLLARARAEPRRAKTAWMRALDLRKSLLAIVHAETQGRKASASDLSIVNEAATEAFAARHLAPSGHLMAWSWKDPASLDIVWWQIALQATELLTDAAVKDRIRTCANNSCGWVFLDLSHAGRRRWCRMGVCGTADKVRKFRERQRVKTASRKK